MPKRSAGLEPVPAPIADGLALAQLGMLTEYQLKGILRAISLDPTRIVYDSTTVVHHHFLNEDTGELMDIDPSQVELQKLPVLPPGMRAESVELIIRVRPSK